MVKNVKMEDEKKSQIDISIIMPSLNVASYIRACIESVLAQTLQEIEILCIDAGSTDGTLEILEEYALRDRRICIINSDKKSYGYQMNIGISKARGRYVGIVETDDYIDACMYESLYSFVNKEQQPDFIKSGYIQFIHVNGKKIFLDFTRKGIEELYGHYICLKDEREKGVLDLNHIWSGIYRREFLIQKKIRFQETPGASYQDLGFSMLVGLLADTGVYVREGYYYYRMDNENSSVKSSLKYRCVVDEFHYVEKQLKEKQVYSHEVKDLIWIQKPAIYCWNALRLSEPEREQFLFEIREEMDEYKENSKYFRILDDSQRMNVKLLRDKSVLREYFKQKEELICKFRSLIELIRGNEKFVLVGAGKYGEGMLLLQEMLDKTYIKAVADNNKKRQGHEWKKYILLSMWEAVQKYGENGFIIANKDNSAEILDELLHLKVDRKKILIFSNMLSLNEMVHYCIYH